MVWDKGFNFRATAAYVTDGANETYSLGVVYPETRNGVTFGWDADISANTRDRDSTVDRRLAGIHQVGSGAQKLFRVDLPNTGTFDVRLANGDTASGQDQQYIELRDDTTVFRTIDDAGGVVADNYNDATGVNRTEAAWPADNAADQRVFASTIFRLALAKTTAYGTNHVLAHIFVSEVGAAAGQPYLSRFHAVPFVPTYGRSLN